MTAMARRAVKDHIVESLRTEVHSSIESVVGSVSGLLERGNCIISETNVIGQICINY